jgi:hypothetical protein
MGYKGKISINRAGIISTLVVFQGIQVEILRSGFGSEIEIKNRVFVMAIPVLSPER